MPALLRRLVLPTIALVVVALVAGAVLGVGLVRRPFPVTSGELEVEGLTGPVTVLRDAQGVAHIYADTPEDLFFGQGYASAQDRFFQMDTRRHVTSGRLAELVGEPGVETDKVIRTLGWRQVAEQELPLLDPDTRRYLRSYAEGVNAYLADNPARSRVALEYIVLGQSVPDYHIEEWTELDSLTWLKAMAWDLRGNYGDELTRARLVGTLPLTQLVSLYPDYPYDRHEPILSADDWSPTTVDVIQPPAEDDADEPDEADGADGNSGQPAQTPDPESTGDAPVPPRGSDGGLQDQGTESPEGLEGMEGMGGEARAVDRMAATSRVLDAVPALVGRGEGIGSNSWVVSGEHTASGMPLLANDPHLGVSQPGIWWQAGLHCREVSPECPFDVTGFTFAGFPGVIIGHNDRVAWGFTNLDPDVTDFYLEDVDGDRYRRDAEWVELEQREELIRVAGGEDVSITVRSTVHGPIVSDVLDDVADAGMSAPVNAIETSGNYEVSLAWTGLEPARTADAVFALNTAQNWEDFREAARLFAVPSQNLIYADVDGNIGYQAPGLVPFRVSSTSGSPPGFWPAPGWQSQYDWQGWVAFEHMPSVYNPDDGMIVTANQAVARSSVPFLTSEWDRGYRAQRILDLLLASGGDLTVDDMAAIQNDDYNAFADVLLPWLLAVDFEGDAFYTEPQQLLAEWDRSAPAGDGDSGAAAMYYYAVWAHLLALTFHDELPADLWPSGNSRWMVIITTLLDDHDHPWWDDRSTAGVVETRDEIIRQAMIEARLDLTRRISKSPNDWQWGRLHQVHLTHEILGGDGAPDLINQVFNEGPVEVPGGSALVNAMNWDASSGSYAVTAAPSMRMVVDLADLDASVWVNQTGNSGHPFHPNYADQIDTWAQGGHYPWPSSPAAVAEASEHELTLVPPQREEPAAAPQRRR